MVYALSGNVWRGRPVSNRKSNLTRLIAGAFVAAAAAVPLYAAVSTDNAQVTAGPCLAWFGNKEDGKCLSYSNGQPVFIGTPMCDFGTGPNAGCSSGPLLPGTSINQDVG